MTDRVSGVGSRLSGETERDSLPTPDGRHPTAHERNWPLLYGLVIAELALLIVIFYAFTKAFA
jgi:hypothetical protein